MRERKADISLLTNYFLDKYGKKINPEVKEISQEALEALIKYSWPGNVRELENIIERVLTLANHKVILPEDLPQDIRENSQISAKVFVPSEAMALSEAVENLEKEMIVQALERTDWQLARTAKQLDISRRVLKYKMDTLAIKGKKVLDAE